MFTKTDQTTNMDLLIISRDIMASEMNIGLTKVRDI
jgi:hypothetical protein